MVRILNVHSGKLVFAGSLAECEYIIDRRRLRVVADNRAGDTLWVI